jgi:hypothetical protein
MGFRIIIDFPIYRLTVLTRVLLNWETKTKRNETKRNEIQRSETKNEETKRNDLLSSLVLVFLFRHLCSNVFGMITWSLIENRMWYRRKDTLRSIHNKVRDIYSLIDCWKTIRFNQSTQACLIQSIYFKFFKMLALADLEEGGSWV